MDQASQQGIIFIDGSGPTYATATVSSTLSINLLFFLELVGIYRHSSCFGWYNSFTFRY
jgi:hypothetical protein